MKFLMGLNNNLSQIWGQILLSDPLLLMGLNNNLSQIWGQILLSDPLLSIGNVFSLILQEEAHCEIFDQNTTNSESLAFSVHDNKKFCLPNSFDKNVKKQRLSVATVIFLDTLKQCYKLIGYPFNYFKNYSPNIVNQIDTSPVSSSDLTSTQCQQLIQLLSTKLMSNTTTADFATMC